jgi:hypothetical protein
VDRIHLTLFFASRMARLLLEAIRDAGCCGNARFRTCGGWFNSRVRSIKQDNSAIDRDTTPYLNLRSVSLSDDCEWYGPLSPVIDVINSMAQLCHGTHEESFTLAVPQKSKGTHRALLGGGTETGKARIRLPRRCH